MRMTRRKSTRRKERRKKEKKGKKEEEEEEGVRAVEEGRRNHSSSNDQRQMWPSKQKYLHPFTEKVWRPMLRNKKDFVPLERFVSRWRICLCCKLKYSRLAYVFLKKMKDSFNWYFFYYLNCLDILGKQFSTYRECSKKDCALVHLPDWTEVFSPLFGGGILPRLYSPYSSFRHQSAWIESPPVGLDVPYKW